MHLPSNHYQFSGMSDKARSRRILVVDDSKLQRKILQTSLKRWGYQVAEADSGEAALEISQDFHPEIILSDWMMPGLSGPDFCKEFRDRSNSSYTYFILFTSKSDRAEIASGLEAGADDFLTKPVDGHELRARIRAGERILDMQQNLTDKNEELQDAFKEVERLNEAVDKDLREARKLQQSLIPERHKTFETFQISLLLRSCGYVGGDLVGFYPAGPHHIGVYAIDVSGHGISAALMTARLAGFLSPVAPDQNVGLQKLEDGGYAPIPPVDAIQNLNTRVLEQMDTEHYFTMLLGDIDQRTGLLRLGQAGHPHPLLHRATGEIIQESPGGFPVGLFDQADFSSFEIQLEPGDRVMLFSDGVTECTNSNGDMLGEEGVADIAEDLNDLTGPMFLEAFMWNLTDFANSPSMTDDISTVVIDYSG
ncbi:MAG: PP2C family protein-serine/threonine phosphatase [Paracoccaceae bacterium]